MDHSVIGVSSSPDLDQYTEAKIKAQAQFKAIRKSATHPVDGFKFATFKDCTDAMLAGLLANGFPMPTFATGYGPKGWVIVAKLTHKSGQWESSTLPLLMGYEMSQVGLQRMAAEITEAKKVLFKALAGGWEEGDEPEAPKEEPKAEEPKQEQPKSVIPDKPAKVKELTILERATKRLEEKFKTGNQAEVEKIFDHLDLLAGDGTVTVADIAKLRTKYPRKEVAHAQ